VGTVLVILFAVEGTLTYRLLGHRLTVFIGLLSYSLYLWHQPIFAFLRAYSVEHPSQAAFSIAIFFIFLLAYLSWRYIEQPFRNKSAIKRSSVFAFALVGSVFFIAVGLFLNTSYGLPGRVYDASIKIEDMDKRIYNERVFVYKKDIFNSEAPTKILILGNSFARDFVNITLETFDTSNVEILYRDDLQGCIYPFKNAVAESLYSEADVIVFASGGLNRECLEADLAYAASSNKKIFHVGTKYYGYNLNWLIRHAASERGNKYNVIPDDVLNADAQMAQRVPAANYISLLKPVMVGNSIPITDDSGRMISTDRTHLTKYGAIYFGQKAVAGTAYSEVFK
jgi:hypothetical protein